MDLLLLIFLTILSLTSCVASALCVFQTMEIQRDLHDLILKTLDLENVLRKQFPEETEMLVGKTWMTSPAEMARVEQTLQQQSRSRAHGRTGFDPFTQSSKLAP